MNIGTVGETTVDGAVDGAIDEAADLSLAEELGSAIGRLHVLLRQAVLPPRMSLAQARALATLRRAGPQRVTDLAASEHVAQPTMSALVARMERAGWVERRVDEIDRRAVVVRLSASGGLVLDELMAARARLLKTYLDGLPAADRATLAAAVAVLNKISSAAGRGG
ncbi:MAG TPA: MarR family transcriptional regulator [Streptosporangiaceae bacterium]